MGDLDTYMQVNRSRWDEIAPIHRRNQADFYPIDAFKAGEDILSPIEAAEIGDVGGKRLVHLQCHFGLDTLALARRGAVGAGLHLAFLREHERIPWQAYPMMVPAAGRGMYRLPDGHSGLPLAFSLKAVRG